MAKRKQARAAVETALKAFRRGDDLAPVTQAFDRLVAVDPTSDNWGWYGRVLGANSDAAGAANAFNRAAQAGDFSAYLDAARAYQTAGDLKNAERMYLAILPSRQKYTDHERTIVSRYVRFLGDQGRFDEARAVVETKLKQNRYLGHFDMWRVLADSMAQNGQIEAAKDVYDSALAPMQHTHNSHVAEFHIHHAEWLTKLGDPERAIEAYERAERTLISTGLFAYRDSARGDQLAPNIFDALERIHADRLAAATRDGDHDSEIIAQADLDAVRERRRELQGVEALRERLDDWRSGDTAELVSRLESEAQAYGTRVPPWFPEVLGDAYARADQWDKAGQAYMDAVERTGAQRPWLYDKAADAWSRHADAHGQPLLNPLANAAPGRDVLPTAERLEAHVDDKDAGAVETQRELQDVMRQRSAVMRERGAELDEAVQGALGSGPIATQVTVPDQPEATNNSGAIQSSDAGDDVDEPRPGALRRFGHVMIWGNATTEAAFRRFNAKVANGVNRKVAAARADVDTASRTVRRTVALVGADPQPGSEAQLRNNEAQIAADNARLAGDERALTRIDQAFPVAYRRTQICERLAATLAKVNHADDSPTSGRDQAARPSVPTVSEVATLSERQMREIGGLSKAATGSVRAAVRRFGYQLRPDARQASEPAALREPQSGRDRLAPAPAKTEAANDSRAAAGNADGSQVATPRQGAIRNAVVSARADRGAGLGPNGTGVDDNAAAPSPGPAGQASEQSLESEARPTQSSALGGNVDGVGRMRPDPGAYAKYAGEQDTRRVRQSAATTGKDAPVRTTEPGAATHRNWPMTPLDYAAAAGEEQTALPRDATDPASAATQHRKPREIGPLEAM